jgi:protease PrsW
MVWFVIAVAFGGVWTYAFYREDIHDREPWWLIGVALLGGAASMWLALWIENRLLPNGVAEDAKLLLRLKAVYLVAGPVEEFCKFLAIFLLVWPRSQFNEPMDGIVYAVAAAAGFATAENFYFLHGDTEGAARVVLARGPIGVAVHILFSSFWGGALAHAKVLSNRFHRFRVICLGLVAAAIVHGTFDAIVFTGQREITLAQARTAEIILVAFCFAFLRWRMRVALALSPFREAAH